MKQGSNIGEPLMGLEERSTSECQRPSNSRLLLHRVTDVCSSLLLNCQTYDDNSGIKLTPDAAGLCIVRAIAVSHGMIPSDLFLSKYASFCLQSVFRLRRWLVVTYYKPPGAVYSKLILFLSY